VIASTTVAVLIATKDRSEALRLLLNRLLEQTLRPAVVTIVDASGERESRAVEQFVETVRENGLSVVLLRAERPSMTGQRNQGVRHVQSHFPSIRFVQVFDDDVRPDVDHLARSVAVFTEPGNEDVGGVTGVTSGGPIGQVRGPMRIYLKMFGLLPGRPGSLSRAGRSARYPEAPRPARAVAVEWVLGCSMFRTEVYSGESYWEPTASYVLYEDVDFSVRLRRRWRLVLLPDLVMEHDELSSSSPDYYQMGFQEVAHRHRVVSQLREAGSLAGYWWSVVGLLILLALRAARRPRRDLRRLGGAIAGTWAAISNPAYR
jgi:GT2 family glycosyltransferase